MKRQASLYETPRVETSYLLAFQAFELRLVDLRRDGADDSGGVLVLYVEDIIQRPVEPLRPQVTSGLRIDQLCRYADSISRLPGAAVQHIPHGEVFRDRVDVYSLSLVDEGRIAGDYQNPVELREARDDVFRHAVGEEFLLRIAGHVLEREYRDGGLVGFDVFPGDRPSTAFRRKAIDPHRSRDMLYVVLPNIREGRIDPIANGIVHHPRNTDPAGHCQCFDTGGDIDALVVDVGAVIDDVAEVHPHAKIEGAFGKSRLHGNRALDCVLYVRKLGKEPVAGVFHDAPGAPNSLS